MHQFEDLFFESSSYSSDDEEVPSEIPDGEDPDPKPAEAGAGHHSKEPNFKPAFSRVAMLKSDLEGLKIGNDEDEWEANYDVSDDDAWAGANLDAQLRKETQGLP